MASGSYRQIGTRASRGWITLRRKRWRRDSLIVFAIVISSTALHCYTVNKILLYSGNRTSKNQWASRVKCYRCRHRHRRQEIWPNVAHIRNIWHNRTRLVSSRAGLCDYLYLQVIVGNFYEVFSKRKSDTFIFT